MPDLNALLNHDTVALDDTHNELVIIDQTLLPGRLAIARLKNQEDIWEAIKRLRVRGAPALGVAAACAIYLAAKNFKARGYEEFAQSFAHAQSYLNSARPTAVNVSWALGRMRQRMQACAHLSVNAIVAALKDEAMAIRDEDIKACLAIGEHGLSLLKPGYGLLTHCNAGRLATIKYGTATAPMYLGAQRGYAFKIFVDETRPLLQGARLTASELMAAGLDVTLICDSMAASLMRQGKIDAVLVGCDRVAANGDAANKIGTLPLAIVAKHFSVPIYFCAPTASIDMRTADGKGIAIEQRDASEITNMWYEETMAPAGCQVFNPAFDVTPHSLITAFITEYGLVHPPFFPALQKLFAEKTAAARSKA